MLNVNPMYKKLDTFVLSNYIPTLVKTDLLLEIV